MQPVEWQPAVSVQSKPSPCLGINFFAWSHRFVGFEVNSWCGRRQGSLRRLLHRQRLRHAQLPATARDRAAEEGGSQNVCPGQHQSQRYVAALQPRAGSLRSARVWLRVVSRGERGAGGIWRQRSRSDSLLRRTFPRRRRAGGGRPVGAEQERRRLLVLICCTGFYKPTTPVSFKKAVGRLNKPLNKAIGIKEAWNSWQFIELLLQMQTNELIIKTPHLRNVNKLSASNRSKEFWSKNTKIFTKVS